MDASVRQRTDALRASLLEGCCRVPVQQYQTWDVERVRAFKAAVVRAKKVAAAPRSSAGDLEAQINALGTFWR